MAKKIIFEVNSYTKFAFYSPKNCKKQDFKSGCEGFFPIFVTSEKRQSFLSS